MKTLFPAQQQSVDTHLRNLKWWYSSLDTSATGVGKTVISAAVARELGFPVTVVCPKIVIPSWRRELEERGVGNVTVVSNYEMLKRGKSVFKKKGKKNFEWVGPTMSLVIWDEVHKCCGAFTQNANMLVASVQSGNYNLMLSATSFLGPPEMRAIGYALGLHNLHKSEDDKLSWFSWMKSLGCRKDPWNNWAGGIPKKIREMGAKLYEKKHAIKLTPHDLPGAFTDNHVITESLQFTNTTQIKKAYDDLGITSETLDAYINGDVSPPPNDLVAILRARQIAEASKVPDIISMINDLVTEGVSVVVFVNFVDTLQTIYSHFRDSSDVVSLVHGKQTAEDREKSVNDFQNNYTKIMLCNIAAGGAGVSFHDTCGTHPRVSLISPTFNFKEHVQALGRIHRAGAKSNCLQRVLISEDSVEERVIRILEHRRNQFDNIHGKD